MGNFCKRGMSYIHILLHSNKFFASSPKLREFTQNVLFRRWYYGFYTQEPDVLPKIDDTSMLTGSRITVKTKSPGIFEAYVISKTKDIPTHRNWNNSLWILLANYRKS